MTREWLFHPHFLLIVKMEMQMDLWQWVQTDQLPHILIEDVMMYYLLEFCTRNGYQYEGSSQPHIQLLLDRLQKG